MNKITTIKSYLLALSMACIMAFVSTGCSTPKDLTQPAAGNDTGNEAVPSSNLVLPENAYADYPKPTIKSVSLTEDNKVEINWEYNVPLQISTLIHGFNVYVQSPKFYDEQNNGGKNYDKQFIYKLENGIINPKFVETYGPLEDGEGKYMFWIKPWNKTRDEVSSSEPVTIELKGYKAFQKTIDKYEQLEGEYFVKNFNEPHDIAINPDNGNIFVADSENHKIVYITSDGTYINEFGSKGSKDTQFYYPTSVCVAKNGFGIRVFVADFNNDRIKSFILASNGTFQSPENIGKKTNEALNTIEADFTGPTDIAYDKDNDVLYVAETYSNRIQKVTLTSTGFGTATPVIQKSDGDDPSNVQLVTSIAVTKDHLYVLDKLGADVAIKIYQNNSDYTSAGQHALTEKYGIEKANKIRVFNNLIYVTETNTTLNTHRVHIFKNTGNELKYINNTNSKWGFKGADNGELNNPMGIEVDSDDNIYVVEKDNNRISVFK